MNDEGPLVATSLNGANTLFTYWASWLLNPAIPLSLFLAYLKLVSPVAEELF